MIKTAKILMIEVVSLLLFLQVTCVCIADDAIETDYYRATVNSDGSLDIVNKDTDENIVSGSPRFYLDYGATDSSQVTIINSSCEEDNNHDNIPDWWYVDNTIARISTEQASVGSKSLKFNATTQGTDNRRAYSPILAISENSKYTISIDSYIGNWTVASGAYVRIFAFYYSTSNATGKGTASSNYIGVPVGVGSWVHNSFEWTPPEWAKSFRVMMFVAAPCVTTIYFDNVSVIKKTIADAVNGSNIESTLTVNGDITTITATDDTNPYVTVNHQYNLNTHSPYIDYTATMRYKQDVLTTRERFDFFVPTQNAEIITRDMQLTSFYASNKYWSDLYAAKVVRFTNGLSFLGSDTMQSMRLQASGTDSQVSFYSDYAENHPHFNYIQNGYSSSIYTNETQRYANETCSASVTFAINTQETLPYLVKTRQPYGYDATLSFTNHPDFETLAPLKAVAYGTENESDPNYGRKGIVGRGLGWTKGIFISGQVLPYMSLNNANFKTLTDQMYRDGVEIVGHTITYFTDSRLVVAAGLATLSQYNAKNWIDHYANDGLYNWEDIASQGAFKGGPYYILDLLDQYNYQYAWSYIDLSTDNHALNMLKPETTGDIRPILFYNNRIDNDPCDSKKIYLWSSVITLKIPDDFYTTDKVDRLINERGVHIGHEYLGYATCKNHAWYTDSNDNNTTKIWPAFDSELAYIAQKRADGLLWSPTIANMGDYLVPLKDVTIKYNPNSSATVTNNSSVDITGITLLAEYNIRSIKINNNYDLISFGGSYGDKELVLPTIASGHSVVLDIVYGNKSSTTAVIVSNDIGKNKINEITGYWDDANEILIMTAEGRSSNSSFTVTMPSLAGRLVSVEADGINNIGTYQASEGTGTITFGYSLNGLHTFKIATINRGIVDDFSSYNNMDELLNIWCPYFASIKLNTDYNYTDGKVNSMEYTYCSDATVEANVKFLHSSIGENWLAGGGKSLSVSFFGKSSNSILPMYIAIMDNTGHQGFVTYGDDGEDINDLCVESWHEWNIAFENFIAAGVNLADVKKISISFGGGPGSGRLYIANIRLYKPRCILSERSADFARIDYAPYGDICGDCVIDYQELAMMANEWLKAPPTNSNVDLNSDGIIDFKDFTILANYWLKTDLWP